MNPPIRILRIIARLNMGGPARHVTILDKGLRARGFETLLAFGEIGPGEASLEHLIDEAGIPAQRVRGLGRRVSPVSDLRAFSSLVALVFRMRPDVVHTHTAKAGTLGRLAAFLYNLSRPADRRCLIVHTFHGHVLHGYFGMAASAVVRIIERLLGRVTDIVLVLSVGQREDIAIRYRIADARRVRVVPLGLELDALTQLPPRSLTAEPVVFGFVGRFVPIKNVPVLVEAFAEVQRSFPHCRLLLVGDGEAKPAIEAVVARLGLASSVEFAGWREDLPALYRSIDVLVLCSLNEGTPVAVIEAMAAAVPVVATSVGGVPDVIEDGRTGLLVPAGSAHGLADAMLRLARDPAARTRLGDAAREAVSSRFSGERLVVDVADLYGEAVEALRRGRADVCPE